MANPDMFYLPDAYRASDAARRLADAWNLHAQFPENNGKWLAVRLQDATGDGVIYDSREAAITHQSMPEYCCYAQLRPMPMKPCEAQDFLDFHRLVFDAGHRGLDAETPLPIMPLEYARNAVR